MKRFNTYILDKWEDLPWRLSSKRASKAGMNWWRDSYHFDDKIYRLCKCHLAKHIDKPWVNFPPLPHYYYNWLEPDVVVQDRISGLWHLRRSSGRFSGYGYRTSKKLYKSLRHGEYYVDHKGFLRKAKLLQYRYYAKIRFDHSKYRKERKEEFMVKHLSRIADYYMVIKVGYYYVDYYRFETVVRFVHPVTEEHISTNLTHAIAIFNKYNKTYFINYLGKYYTNLKWSLKQNY